MAFERTLVLIRERPLPELLDLAVVVARRRPAALGLAALGGIAPFAALNAWLFAAVDDLPAVAPLVLWALEAPIATAPIAVVLGDLMFGRAPSARRTLASLGRASIRLAVAQGFLRLVPLLAWFPPRLAFADEILLLEGASLRRLWRRGGELTGGRAGVLVGFGMLQFGMTLAFAMVAALAIERVGAMLWADPGPWEPPQGEALRSWRFQGPLWLGAAFFAVGRFFTYIDQRVRLEGWEVELRLRAVGQALAKEGRW